MDKCLQYLDNAYSRHMFGYKTLSKRLDSGHEGTKTFGDGSKFYIEGKWIFEIPRLSPLTDVLFVKGLKANLLSNS